MTAPQPSIPAPARLWRSTRFWIWLLYILVILAAVPDYFVQYWFNQSLGFKTIFWTNVEAQLLLFFAYGLLLGIVVWLPIRWHAASPAFRKAGVHLAMWIGAFGGWLLARHYLEFLLAFHGVPFHSSDPVFGKDIGFYVYWLPVLRDSVFALEAAILVSIGFTLAARADALHAGGVFDDPEIPVGRKAGLLAAPYLNFLLYCLGAVTVAHTWLGRYELLLKDNEPSGVRLGAEYLDLVGLFSSLNNVYLKMFVETGLTLVVGISLSRIWKSARPLLAGPLKCGAALLALELGFFLGLVIKGHLWVSPNEPHIQREFIQRHIQATLKAYRLDKIQVQEWTPPEQPLPAGRLLASRTVQNAPILPSWVTYLEEPPDIQHYRRIQITGSTYVFGPMLKIFQQQQQLRPYYRFTSVDGVRYEVDGQKRMYVSAVRELPSLAFLGAKEWLRYWGSAALMYTHGMGLVMSPVNEINEVGNPLYAVYDIPPKATSPALEHEPRIYFGEGAKDNYVLTNLRNLKEFDHATEQFREEFVYPEGLASGIAVNSLFRRVIFAFHTKDLTAFLFSRYIDPAHTRVQIRRQPLARARSIAPFLFLDSNPYAFIADKNVLWMVNALTTSDQYPYAYREILGDKADERAVEKFPERVINYAEDSVKITMDAFTGEVRFYKIADDPIVNSWEKVYPDLFRPASSMPKAVGAQLTYPLQWFHIQFDDIYKRYHQQDPIQFYNVEDLWDDADETLGSIGRGLSGFGTTDQMTFSYEGHHLLIDPADLPPGVNIGRRGELQYVMLMPFTPEGCRNLRSVILAFQDPEYYGRLVSLQIPQGMFVPGPEQIDAYVDNDQAVHQQVTMWIRHGSEVIRGSTLLLPVGGDLLYVEPIWVSSIQNEMPQLKLFAVRYHGQITSGSTLQMAIQRRAPGVEQPSETTVPLPTSLSAAPVVSSGNGR
ncbi:MAG: UPF0182 family protein [Acidobacteria bacterium]|nr:UPF0182 family protein [Acidobacteriota bacterium]